MTTTDKQPPVLAYRPPTEPAFDLELLCFQLEITAVVLSVPALLLMLYGARLPVPQSGYSALGAFLWLIALPAWLFPLLRTAWILAHTPRRGSDSTSRWALRALPPLLFLINFTLLHFAVPRQLFFASNRRAMDDWAAQTLAAGKPPPSSAIIGSYHVHNIERIPGGVRFFVNGCGFFRHGGGFAYSPDRPPPPCGAPQDDYTPAGGAWYFREYDGG